MIRKISFTILMLLATVTMVAQELPAEGVGRKGTDYTYFIISLPAPAQLPEKVDKSIAKQLFDIEGRTIQEAHQAYIEQFEEVLPAQNKNIKLAGYCRHMFEIEWYDYVENRFASLMVKAQRVNAQGKKERNRKKPLFFDLNQKRALKLQDVFTDSVLAVILDNGADRHQFYIDKLGVVKVLSHKDKKWEEEEFSTNGEKELFLPSFLSLINKEGVEQSSWLANAAGTIKSDTNRNASYPGGSSAVIEYFKENVRIPRVALENKRSIQIEVRLEVDVDGSVCDAEILGPVHFSLKDEIVSVAKRMRGWRPAVKDGQIVKSVVPTFRWTYRNPQWREK